MILYSIITMMVYRCSTPFILLPEMNPEPLFWQQTIQPNSRELLVFEMDSTLGVTGASLLKVEEENDNQICRIFAYVHETEEIIPDSTDDENAPSKKEGEKKEEKEKAQNNVETPKEHKFLFASLQPNFRESIELNYIFSPFDIVEIENTVKYPIQITGNYTFLDE